MNFLPTIVLIPADFNSKSDSHFQAGSTVMHLVCRSCPKETVMQYMKKGGMPLLMSDKVSETIKLN